MPMSPRSTPPAVGTSRSACWSLTTTGSTPRRVAEVLEKVGHQCTVATSGKAGAAAIDRDEFDVVLTDLRMSDIDGLAIVRKAQAEQPEAEVVVITGFGDVKTAVEAIKLGAAALPA